MERHAAVALNKRLRKQSAATGVLLYVVLIYFRFKQQSSDALYFAGTDERLVPFRVLLLFLRLFQRCPPGMTSRHFGCVLCMGK